LVIYFVLFNIDYQSNIHIQIMQKTDNEKKSYQ